MTNTFGGDQLHPDYVPYGHKDTEREIYYDQIFYRIEGKAPNLRVVAENVKGQTWHCSDFEIPRKVKNVIEKLRREVEKKIR